MINNWFQKETSQAYHEYMNIHPHRYSTSPHLSFKFSSLHLDIHNSIYSWFKFSIHQTTMANSHASPTLWTLQQHFSFSLPRWQKFALWGRSTSLEQYNVRDKIWLIWKSGLFRRPTDLMPHNSTFWFPHNRKKDNWSHAQNLSSPITHTRLWFETNHTRNYT